MNRSSGCGPLLAGDALRPADPGAADRDPQPGGRLGCGGDRRLDRVGVGDVRLVEAGPLAELAGQCLTLLAVQVRDHDVGAGAVEAPDRGLAEA